MRTIPLLLRYYYYLSFIFQQSNIIKSMKAVRVHQFGGPEVLQYETNIPIPKITSNSVLVCVKAVGINPVETYIRSGTYANKPNLPFIPGNDCAGIVQEVGTGVTRLKSGDRVYVGGTLSGSYAEYTLAEAKNVQPLHSELSFNQGAAIPTSYRTAYRALFIRGAARPGDCVLVHGASGGVGIAAVQFARARGMYVLGTAGSEKGTEFVSQAGAHEFFNHRQEDYFDKIKAVTEGRGGVDMIVENASHFNLGRDLTLLARGGCVAVVGSRGPVEINPRDTMSREASIIGVMLSGISEAEMRETDAAIQGGMEVGWLRPLVGKVFPLEEASKAHEDIISGSALGKMVLTVA